MNFSYQEAFSRNAGFLSSENQNRLKNARVAIAGLGGTGGAQVNALARMGIGNFSLADPDTFEVVNFNRQANATMQTLGRNKAEVAKEAVLAINPDANVRIFTKGLTQDNAKDFLLGADCVVDSLDFYCFRERFLLYEEACKRNQWLFTAPPLGFGFTMLAFDPRGMSFENYFGLLPDMTEKEMLVRFVAGLSPKDYMLRYLDHSAISPVAHRVPSVGAAPMMIAGAIATEVTELLSGNIPNAAPVVYQFDAKLRKFWIGKYRKNSPLQWGRRLLISRLIK